jgi:HPt (histidine-containing phosphotransfer) domain-containing protein
MTALDASQCTGTSSPAGAPVPFDGHPPHPDDTRALAMARFDGDVDFYARIIPLFRQAAVDQASSLADAIDRHDAEQVQHWAHTLKGSLLTVGANATAARAETLESAAREGRTQDLRDAVRQVVAETLIIARQLDVATTSGTP